MTHSDRSFEIERLAKLSDKQLETERDYNIKLLATAKTEHPYFKEKLEVYVTERIDIIDTLLGRMLKKC